MADGANAPVLVTGAGGYVGSRLVARLVERGVPVRGLYRSWPVPEPLEQPGVDVVTGDVLEPSVARKAAARAGTIVHLVGSLVTPLDQYDAVNYRSVVSVLEAAAGGRRRPRFIFLSFPGAWPGSSNAYLRAKGRAEQAIASSGLPYVILRSNHVYGPDSAFLRALVNTVSGRRALVIGSGRQRLQPIYVDDVTAALAAVVERTDLRRDTLDLGGPDVVSYQELLSLVAHRLGRPFKPLHVPRPLFTALAAVMERTSPEPPITRAAVDILARDLLVDPSLARSMLNLRLTLLREGLDGCFSVRP